MKKLREFFEKIGVAELFRKAKQADQDRRPVLTGPKESRWDKYAKQGSLFLTFYIASWVLACTMFLWIPIVLSLAVRLLGPAEILPFFGGIVANLVTGPLAWLAGLVVQVVVLVKYAVFWPERKTFYVLVLAEWPYLVIRGDGRPHLKNPFAKSWAVFSGTETLDDQLTQTTVYTKSQLPLVFNWAVSFQVDKPDLLLTSRFMNDFRKIRLLPTEIETSSDGVATVAEGVNLKDRIRATLLFERIMAVVPGFLQGMTVAKEFEVITSTSGRNEITEAMNTEMEKALRSPVEGKKEERDPGVRFRFLCQNIDLPTKVQEAMERRYAAVAEGETASIAVEKLTEALRKAGLNQEQIAEVVTAKFLGEGDGMGIMGLRSFNRPRRPRR